VPPHPKLSDRWLALIIWLGILLALIFTSGEGAALAIQVGTITEYTIIQANGTTTHSPYQIRVAVILLALLIVLVFFIFRAWTQFASFTLNLLMAYSKEDSDDPGRTIFAKFLILKPNWVMPSTPISDVVRSLAYAWAVLVVVSFLPSIGVLLLQP